MLFWTNYKLNYCFRVLTVQSLDWYDYYDQRKELALARLRDADAMSEEETDD
jgi:hypothetical protein